MDLQDEPSARAGSRPLTKLEKIESFVMPPRGNNIVRPPPQEEQEEDPAPFRPYVPPPPRKRSPVPSAEGSDIKRLKPVVPRLESVGPETLTFEEWEMGKFLAPPRMCLLFQSYYGCDNVQCPLDHTPLDWKAWTRLKAPTKMIIIAHGGHRSMVSDRLGKTTIDPYGH
jgi:hypothetical protein